MRRTRCWIAISLILALFGSHALGYIERMYSLDEVLKESSNVHVGWIRRLDRERRLALAVIEGNLKGKGEFRQVKMNLGTAAEDQVDYLVKRLAKDIPFILFYQRQGNSLVACAHAGDTWYQLHATDQPERDKVWWRMTHIEVFMGRTYNGTTRELIRLTADVLAGRAAAPKADPSVPRLDLTQPVTAAKPKSPKRRTTVAKVEKVTPPARVEDVKDGLEAVPGWAPDEALGRPAKLAIEATADRGRILRVRCDGYPGEKLAVALTREVDLSRYTRLAARVGNECDSPVRVAAAFACAPDWTMFEAPGVSVPPKTKGISVSFSLTARDFKSENSQGRHTQPVPNRGQVGKVLFLVDGVPETGEVTFDSVRGDAGGLHRTRTFSHPSGEAGGICWADPDSDLRFDVFLCSQGGNAFLSKAWGGFRDATQQAGLSGRSQSASWADYDADGDPDLLTGSFQLFTHTGKAFRDDTRLIQLPGDASPASAAWVDYNGDGRPDVLLADRERGLRLLENTGQGPRWFRDVSDKAGLGPKGLGVGKGTFVALADYDGDGYTDLVCNAGGSVLAHNEGDGTFTQDTRCGIKLPSGSEAGRGVAFADFDNDGNVDLFVPAAGKPRLYRNNNDGTFTDVLDSAGELADHPPGSVAAAWGDVNRDGFLDLFVCHAEGASRLYLGGRMGRFTDATEAVGLSDLSPASAASFVDADGDNDLDLFVNLHDKVALLLNDVEPVPHHVPLTVHLSVRKGLVGAVVRLLGARDWPLGLRELSGSDGCGGQVPPVAHFGVSLGSCRISVCLSDGRLARRNLIAGPGGARLTLHDRDFR